MTDSSDTSKLLVQRINCDLSDLASGFVHFLFDYFRLHFCVSRLALYSFCFNFGSNVNFLAALRQPEIKLVLVGL